jgi:acyl-CoA reductase-like NAD-dependent aldehyde dehydrogenase
LRSALTAGTDHGSLIVRDPEDGSVIGEIAETTRNEVESALQRGYLAQRSPPPATHERAGILAAVADKVQADFEEHA